VILYWKDNRHVFIREERRRSERTKKGRAILRESGSRGRGRREKIGVKS